MKQNQFLTAAAVLILAVAGTAFGQKTISGGVVNGKAVSLPQPVYPAGARGASGAVSVRVTIDESGAVVEARAVSGHDALRAAAETAARRAKFKPTLLSGEPVRVTGILVYNFIPGTAAEQTNNASNASDERRGGESLAPDSKRAEAKRHFQDGLRFGQAREWEKAARSFKRAAEIDPTDAVVFYNLGTAYYNAGQYAMARDAYDEAVRLGSEEAEEGLADAEAAINKETASRDEAARASRSENTVAASQNQMGGGSPPAGRYLCYFYASDNYPLMSSSLTLIDILPKRRMSIAGEVVSFSFDGSALRLLDGSFAGVPAHLKTSDGKPAIVFRRKEVEAVREKIDVSDTWCYFDK